MWKSLPNWLLLFALGAALSHGAVIAENTVGTNHAEVYLGQSFTTPADGPWTNISVSFGTLSGPATPTGTLYIFTSAYTGTPQDLSGASALAQTNTIVGSEWVFSPGFTLQSNQQYFLFLDSLIVVAGSLGNPYSGGNAYFSSDAQLAFSSGGLNDAIFQVSGTNEAVVVPEPSPFATVATVLVGIGLGLRQRSQS
ncbi:hypothetical protein [Bryobacter aggregatus]|uniref:hypothetical protein n=1 Tax=Bryobacter aggregatus TaxID=360054 RepID=UPI0004E23621|nr:hypothetical protein [Bryobacter aggregatus]